MSLLSLSDYEIDEKFGFLLPNPLENLPSYFEPWTILAANLALHIQNGTLRDVVKDSPVLDHQKLTSYEQRRLAHLQLSTIAGGYIWCQGDKNVPKSLPRAIAVPLWAISKELGMKPVASHADVCLANYKIKENAAILEDGDDINILFARFVTDFDNEWFYAVLCHVEMAFAKCVNSIVRAISLNQTLVQNVIMDVDISVITKDIVTCLLNIEDSVNQMSYAQLQMRKKCRPDVFFNGFRPFLAGYSGKAFSGSHGVGIIFEGVSRTPVSLVGGSGAQSPVMQVIDAFLGTEIPPDKKAYLIEMREYMIPGHKLFIEDIQRVSCMRQVVQLLNGRTDIESKAVVNHYNSVVESMARLRSKHIQLVAQYIIQAASRQPDNNYSSLNKEGTGGNTVMSFLKGIRDSTMASHIQS